MAVRLVTNEELPPPLGGYRLIERLGRGGFGEVWKAEAPGGFHKAVKFVFGDLDSADEDGRPAEQEQKALKRMKDIRHPYILSLERHDVIDGQLIIVMELAERNLWQRFVECRGKGLTGIPREELLRFLDEAAEALDMMNDVHHIQHLDVKPQNLFVMYNHVKVADFGLAKTFEGMRGTVTGGVTPVYAAPETFEGWISRFTDQYSLAIVYQELLTGTRPITGANTKQLLLQHLNGTPDLAALPAADRPVIARALAKKPEHRWGSCGEMVRALRAATTGGSGTVRPPGSGGVRGSGSVRVPPSPPSSPVGAATPNVRTAVSRPQPAAATMVPAGPSALTTPAQVFAKPSSGSITNTPRPTLVTPKLVTPQANAANQPGPALTLSRATLPQPVRAAGLGLAPPERTADGVLFPAILVAVGGTGLAVLRAFRAAVRDRFGSVDAVPTVRYVYIDTDPDAAAAAAAGPDPLSAREVILARLNRPAHYMQRDGVPPVEQWLPAGLLHTLPKNPAPANGVRAFGRLALVDHYKAVAQKVRQELEPFLSDALLDMTGQSTGLGVRSNRAKAYVLAGTGGGTGGGMAVDLGYVLRHELASAGYRGDATAVLLAPPADPAGASGTALANTYATLAEVGHFAAAGGYATRFDTATPPVVGDTGPFARTALFPLPKRPQPKDQEPAYAVAARAVFLDLLTTAGRTIDHVRAVTPKGAGPAVAVAGLHRFSWPRAELLDTLTRRFSQQVLGRWAHKDAPHLREPIAAWLTDQWAKLKLDPAAVEARLEAAARAAVGGPPAAVFDALLDPVRTLSPGSPAELAREACHTLDQLIKLVGRPQADNAVPGSLEGPLDAALKAMAAETDAGLSTLAVSFIERPQYRVAGAEEALAQLTARVTATLDALAAAHQAQAQEAVEIYARLFQVIGGLQGGGLLVARKGALAAELLDLLRRYPTARLLTLQSGAAVSLYRGILGGLPEYVRDVGFCRTRLQDMAAAAGPPAVSVTAAKLRTLVLPVGCDDLDAAADQFLAALAPDEFLAFDQALQQDVKKKFRGLVSLCLKAEKTADFLALLRDKAMAFLDARLERNDPATLLLKYRGDGPDLMAVVAAGYAKAAPVPVDGRPTEAAVLAGPAGPAGDRLRHLAAVACGGAEFIPAPLADDVVIYRECPAVPLAGLPHLGEHARAAFDALSAAGHPPHARRDVPWPT